MKALIARSPVGIFAFSENGELLHYKLFDRNAEKAVKDDTKDFISELKGYDIADGGYEFLRKNIREFALSLGFASSDEEFNKFIIAFCTQYSKSRISSLIGKDKFMIQATNALDDLEKIYNLMDQRLYEWFSLHYPEIKQKNVAELIIKHGKREHFPNFRSSNGIDLSEADEKILKDYAQNLKNVSELIKNLENYIRNSVKDVAPNVSSLLDAILAARLISLAGSLEKLARMPASTIQLLGAEKALFRHLHKKGKSPKYGILFNASIIQHAKEQNRGKAARILSAKLMQAAKIDFYSGRFEPKLKQDLLDEIKKVQ